MFSPAMSSLRHDGRTEGDQGAFQKGYELLNLRAVKNLTLNKNISFSVRVRYILWNFKCTL